MPRSSARCTACMNSSSSILPYPPPISQQPMPIAETCIPVCPNGRYSMLSSFQLSHEQLLDIAEEGGASPLYYSLPSRIAPIDDEHTAGDIVRLPGGKKH